MNLSKIVSPKILYWSKIIVIGLLVGVGLQLAQAWTSPGSNAPSGNVAGPITTSGVSQTKSGDLILGRDIAVARNAVFGTYVSVSNTLGLCLNGDCRTSWPSGGGGSVNSVTGGTGVSVTGTTDVTINADTSVLQRRITGSCSGGEAITQVNADGSVSCGAPTIDPATIFSSATTHTCNRFGSSGQGTTYCSISGSKSMCFLTRTYGRDGDDVDGFGCTLTRSGNTWGMQAFGEDFDQVYCTAMCI